MLDNDDAAAWERVPCGCRHWNRRHLIENSLMPAHTYRNLAPLEVNQSTPS